MHKGDNLSTTANVWQEGSVTQELCHQALFENGNDGIALLKNGVFIDCNRRFEEMISYQRSFILGKEPADISPERQPDGQLSAFSAEFHMAKADKFNHEVFNWVIRKASGDLVELEINLNAVNRNNEEEYIIAVGKDLETKNRLLLNRSDELFRNTFEKAGVGIAHLNMKGEYIRVNQKYQELLGYSFEELRKFNFKEITYSEDLELDVSKTLQLSNGEIESYSLEKRYYCRSGKIKWFNLTASIAIDSTNNEKYFIAVLQDIDKRKNAELQLRIFSEAVRNVPVSILITDINGNVEYVNPAFENITGYKSDEVMGENPKFLSSGLHPISFYQELWQIILNKQIWVGEFKNKRKSGKLFWEHAAIAPILDDNREISRFVAVKEDISERKLQEERMQKALSKLKKEKRKAEESDRLKTSFLSTISHELRTPLNAINGFSELVLNKVDPEKNLDYVQVIKNQGSHLLRVIEQILELSVLDAKVMEFTWQKVNVLELINKQFEKAKEMVFQHDKPYINVAEKNTISSNLYAKVDEDKLQQVFNNLIDNAIKFTEHGQVEIISKYENKEISIEIKDSGIGIPKEKQKHIFERFRQVDDSHSRKYNGLGIGLAISKKLMKAMGGDLSFISRDEGTSFFVKLSCEITTKETKDSQETIKITNRAKPNILIVEDQELNYEYIKEVLTAQRFNFHWVKNGEQALNLIYSGYEPSLVLMDLKMPVMDGYETTKQLRSAQYHFPIVALTSYSFPNEITNARLAGCDEVLVKPIKLEKLQNIVKKYVYV